MLRDIFSYPGIAYRFSPHYQFNKEVILEFDENNSNINITPLHLDDSFLSSCNYTILNSSMKKINRNGGEINVKVGDKYIRQIFPKDAVLNTTNFSVEIINISYCVDPYQRKKWWCGGADINHDGKVDVADLAIISANYGKNCSIPDWCSGADINKDGKVDDSDMDIFLSHQGKKDCEYFYIIESNKSRKNIVGLLGIIAGGWRRDIGVKGLAYLIKIIENWHRGELKLEDALKNLTEVFSEY